MKRDAFFKMVAALLVSPLAIAEAIQLKKSPTQNGFSVPVGNYDEPTVHASTWESSTAHFPQESYVYGDVIRLKQRQIMLKIRPSGTRIRIPTQWRRQ